MKQRKFDHQKDGCDFDGTKVQQKVKLMVSQKFSADSARPECPVEVKNGYQPEGPEHQKLLVIVLCKGQQEVERHEKQAQHAVENNDEKVVPAHFLFYREEPSGRL